MDDGTFISRLKLAHKLGFECIAEMEDAYPSECRDCGLDLHYDRFGNPEPCECWEEEDETPDVMADCIECGRTFLHEQAKEVNICKGEDGLDHAHLCPECWTSIMEGDRE